MIVVYDTAHSRRQLYPLSLTRPIADLLVGTTTLANWWAMLSKQPIATVSEKHLTVALPSAAIYHCIDATVLPDAELCAAILQMQPGEVLEDATGIIAFCTAQAPVFGQMPVWSSGKTLEVTAKRFDHATTCHHVRAT